MLPKSAQEILELIGPSDAAKFIKTFGGTNIYFSENLINKADVSQESLDLLLSKFKNSYVFIPKCYTEILNKRNNNIRQSRREGASIKQLSRSYNLTDRRIMSICSITTCSKSTSSTGEPELDIFT